MKLLPSFSTLLLIELDETIPTHAQVEMIMETIDKMTDPVPVIGETLETLLHSKKETKQLLPQISMLNKR